MPTVSTSGRDLYYETDGEGQTVAFVGDVGYGAWLWGWHQPALTGPYRTLVWDFPGTGLSDPPAGPLAVDDLAADLEVVLAASDSRRVHLVGAGLGGMVALRYARAYGRARSLTLFGTAATGEAVDGEALADLALDPESPASCRPSLAGAFSDAFLDGAPDLVERICEWRLAEDATGEDRAAQADAMLEFEAGPPYEMALPTLVVHGVDDPVVPMAAGEELAADLPRGSFDAVEGRHLGFVEHSAAVADRLAAFLDDVVESDG